MHEKITVSAKDIDALLFDGDPINRQEAVAQMFSLLKVPLLESLRTSYNDGSDNRPMWLFCSRYSMLLNAFIQAQTGIPIVSPLSDDADDQRERLWSHVCIYDPPRDDLRKNKADDHTVSIYSSEDGEAYIMDGVGHLLWDKIRNQANLRFLQTSMPDLDGSLRDELHLHRFSEERAIKLNIDLLGEGAPTTRQTYLDIVAAMHSPLVLHGVPFQRRPGVVIDTNTLWDTRRLQKAAGLTINRLRVNGFDARRLETVPHT